MKTTIMFTAFLFVLLLANRYAEAADFIVTRTDDRNATCVSGVDCSLREAVFAAGTAPTNDTIYFAGSLNGQTITLTDEINGGNPGTLTIKGPSASLLTIDGGAGSNRIFFFTSGTVAISDVTLTGGNANSGAANGIGGAIAINGSNLTLNRVHITGNTATQTGGGVANLGGTLTVRNSTFSTNSADNHGGGIDNFSGTLTVVNSTFSANTAAHLGGGIDNFVGTVIVVNSTFSGNTAGNGGGVAMQAGNSMSFANTIIAGNVATMGQPEIYSSGGTTTSAGNNLVGDSPGDSTDTGTPVTYQISDIQNMNPMLGALTIANGGTTPTRALLAGSPAIDAGNNAQAIDPSDSNAPLRRDQRYYLRIANAIVDIGAYEFNAMPTSASVSVSGRVTGEKGAGVSRAVVSLIGSNGVVRTAVTNPFGFYRFEETDAGQTYIITARHKLYEFTPSSQVLFVTEELTGVDFVAAP